MKSLLYAPLLGVLLPAGADGAAPPPTLLQIAGITVAPARLNDSVVIVIDAQRDYTAKLRLAGIDPALREMQRLLTRARAADVPIIHIQQVSPKGRGIFEVDTEGARFAPETTPEPGETVIQKRLPNSFAATTLDDTLRRLGRNELIVVGAMTHLCVSATARAAIDHGYRVTIVADACATRDLPAIDGDTIPATTVQRVALAELADRFATIVPTTADLPE